jgi:membrane-associated phospholipid phosphatase
MMDALRTWDIEAFRAVHRGISTPLLDPFMLYVTDMGLGHAQLVPLLLARFKDRMSTRTAIIWMVGLALVAAGYEGAIEHQSWAEFFSTLAAFFTCCALFWRLPARWCSGAIWAAAAAGIVRLIIRENIPRWRPSNLEFADAIEPLFGRSSFPSGHATSTLAIGVFLLWASRGTKWAPLCWAIAGWSVLVAFSRVYVGVHYPTDIIAGLCVAIAVATPVWLLLRPRLAKNLPAPDRA